MRRIAPQVPLRSRCMKCWPAFLASACVSTSGIAQCPYEAFVLPVPAGYTSISAADMNGAGEIVGIRQPQVSLQVQGFRWSASTGYETLPPPPGGAQYWYPSRLSESGFVAGSGDVTGVSEFFLQLIMWDASGTASLFPPTQPLNSYGVFGVGDAGWVIGTIEGGNGGVTPIPFIIENGVSLPLPDAFDNMFGGFYCARDDGTVGGARWGPDRRGNTIYEPVIWTPGSAIQLLPPLPPDFIVSKVISLTGDGRALINSRQIVPPIYQPYRTFVFDGSQYTPIGPHEGMQWTYGENINDLGQIVGTSGVLPGASANVPFLWASGVMIDLRTLVTLPPNVTLKTAVKVLDDGRIIVSVRIGPTQIPSVVILTPLTSPEDINLDSHVDAKDLAILLGAWGPMTPATIKRADVDHDGEVGAFDLAAVLGAWTVSP